MTDCDRGFVGFRCARDSVTLAQQRDELNPSKTRFLLFDNGKLLAEVGKRRPTSKPAEDNTLQHQRKLYMNARNAVAKKRSLALRPQICLPGVPSTAGVVPGDFTPAASESLKPVEEETGHQMVEFDPESGMTEEELNDYFTGDVQCAWCDDGGRLIMCDGPCMRGFHMGAPLEKGCNPLKVQEDLRIAIINSKHPFECPNCWAKIFRCFKCKNDFKLKSDKKEPAIAKCDVVDCGRFYCSKCQKEISRETELHLGIKLKTKTSFICPLHFCKTCGSREDHQDDVLFPCRRCPVAFHERCMSRKLRDDPTRVWKAILKEDGTVSETSQVSCNFIYCTRHRTQNMMYGPKHETDLFTPQIWKKWRIAYAMKFKSLKSSIPFLPERSHRAFSLGGVGRNLSDFAVAASVLGNSNTDCLTHAEVFLKETHLHKRRRKAPLTQEDLIESVDVMIQKGQKEVEKAQEQVRGLIEDAMKEVSMERVESSLQHTYPYTASNTVRLTEERLDYFIQSVEKLDFNPSRIRESIPVSLIKKMEKYLKAMRVSCAPFILPNYTSFGRHFTKTSILEHVANHLIAHLQPNNQIVDFSCGSNEFLGIIVDFCRHNSFEIQVKAFDLFTPYRMDGFVKKNWFDVTSEDLDHGDNLIIGLNPPFGVNASLANQFVNHAAKMQPKLMLLICPPQTVIPRDYKVIHEDHELCAEKAFYIPGLRADQGNDVTPPFRVLQRIN